MALIQANDFHEVAKVRKALNDLLIAMGHKPVPDWADSVELKFQNLQSMPLYVTGAVSRNQTAALGEW